MTTLAMIVLLAPMAAPQAAPSDSDAVPADGRTSEDLESRLKAQEREIQELRDKIKEMDSRLDAQEEATLDEKTMPGAEGAEPIGFEPQMNIYGFMDLTFVKYMLDEDQPPYGLLNDTTSFIMNNLNLYFASRMTETLSALVEIRLSFLPHGAETWDGLQYHREDTTILDPYTSEEIQFGGIELLRAHLTWQPYDAFGVIAGRFLTPYGIWNVDHGSPVIIGVRTPYMMIRRTIPPAQTGIQLFGRLIPSSGLYLDYAATLSNGRGPTESVWDLDDNKAGGLRLKLTWETPDVTVSLGGYGYYGEVTDVTKTLHADPVNIEVEETQNYTEMLAAADFLLQVFGVRLQAEYAGGRISYDKRPQRMLPIVDMPSPGQYQPDYVRWDVYVFLGWELPLEFLIGDMKLMPFTMFEHSVWDDTQPDLTCYVIRGGLNFKPNPFVTLKWESTWINFYESELITEPIWTHVAQLAVSF